VRIPGGVSPAKTWAPGLGRQRRSPSCPTRGEQVKKRRAELNAVRGPLVLVLVLRRGTGGRWKVERTGMEEDAQEPGSGGASVVASKSCGQSNVRWSANRQILQLQEKFLNKNR